jgi:hypothetical protein
MSWDLLYGSYCLCLQKDPTEEAELQYDEFGFRLDSDGKKKT